VISKNAHQKVNFMTKWGETFVYIGRIILGIILAITIGGALKMNPYFYKDNITPWLLGIFAGALTVIMLEVLGKGKG